MTTEDEMEEVVQGFLNLVQVEAKRAAKNGKWQNYLGLPGMVIQGIDRKTKSREVFVGRYPVLRVWEERGKVHSRFIVQDQQAE